MSQDPKILLMRTDADGLANFNEEALVVLDLTRTEIEAGNISSALERLMALTDSKETALRFQESLLIHITGYDNDPRELVEVPEVRAFFGKLIQQWPNWLWFLMRSVGAIPLLMGLICQVKVNRREDLVGMEFLDRHELAQKMLDLFERGNAMFLAFGITPAQSEASAASACAELVSP